MAVVMRSCQSTGENSWKTTAVTLTDEMYFIFSTLKDILSKYSELYHFSANGIIWFHEILKHILVRRTLDLPSATRHGYKLTHLHFAPKRCKKWEVPSLSRPWSFEQRTNSNFQSMFTGRLKRFHRIHCQHSREFLIAQTDSIHLCFFFLP